MENMKKKFTVFVSSTYEDLKEERQEVMKTLLEMNCIPCGMEYFPATEDKTLKYIKRIIDDCDYYILILGDKYGSTDAKGISYTEKEYRYAKKRGIPMISFIRDDLEKLPRDKCELDSAKAERLKKFRKLASDKKLCRFWSNKDGLARAVSSSMKQLIEDKPANGWVRADFPLEESAAALKDCRDCGIRRLYPKGLKIESFDRIIKSPACRRFRAFAFSAIKITQCYRNELIQFLSAGGVVQYLLSKPGTQYLEQASLIHHPNQPTHIEEDVGSSIEEIRSIIKEAEKQAKKNGTVCGSFEIRLYDTELRNQLLICDDQDGNVYAWLTVLIPPMRAVNCTLIEYEDTAGCEKYFDTVWERHAADVVKL